MPRAAKDPVTGVTLQQEEFARQWVLTGRHVVAYRRAYPDSEANSNVQREEARRLLDNPAIALRVEYWRKIAESKLEMGVSEIVRGIARVAVFDIRECFDEKGALLRPDEMPEAVALALDAIDVVEMAGGAAIGGDGALSHVPMYTKKVKGAGRIKALEILARIKKLIVERVENVDPNDPRNMSDEQLAAELAATEAANAAIAAASNKSKAKAKARAK